MELFYWAWGGFLADQLPKCSPFVFFIKLKPIEYSSGFFASCGRAWKKIFCFCKLLMIFAVL